jgi:hypothetical protein
MCLSAVIQASPLPGVVTFGKRRKKSDRPSYELGFQPVLRLGRNSDVFLTPNRLNALSADSALREINKINADIAARRARGGTRADVEGLFSQRNAIVAEHDVRFSPRIEQAVFTGVFSPERDQCPGHARFKFGPLSGQLGLRGVHRAFYNLVDEMSSRLAGERKAPTEMGDPISQAYFKLWRPQPLHKHGKSVFGDSPSGPLALWYVGRPLLDTEAPSGQSLTVPSQQLPAILPEPVLKKLFPKGEYKRYCQLEDNRLDVMLSPDIDSDPVMKQRGLTLKALVTPLCSPGRFFGPRAVNQAFLIANDATFHGTVPFAVPETLLRTNPMRSRQNTLVMDELATQGAPPEEPTSDYHRLIVVGDGREKAS